MKKKRSKYRKIWLLWVALEGLVATFTIMNSFLLLRYLYFSHGTAIPEASVSAAGSVLSAVYLPLLITLILTTGFLEHKLSANVTNLMDGLRAVAGGDYSVRLAELTNRTLLLTKLQSQRFVPDRTTFSLDEQIRRCAILLSHSWEEKHLTFSAELETVNCTGSEELLRQVWINLLNNAIRYTPPGGEIGVELKRTGREAAVRVWDTGAGMTAEVQAHIFEEYYQGDPSEKKQGLGLGLSIVHRIVELSGGRIEVASQPQQGSSFTVYLPLIGEEA